MTAPSPVLASLSSSHPLGERLAPSQRATASLVQRGFPRASGPIREWVPGVSTPEGLIVSSAGALALLSVMEPNMFERVIQLGATAAIVTVTTAIPAGAVWFGTHLFHV